MAWDADTKQLLRHRFELRTWIEIDDTLACCSYTKMFPTLNFNKGIMIKCWTRLRAIVCRSDKLETSLFSVSADNFRFGEVTQKDTGCYRKWRSNNLIIKANSAKLTQDTKEIWLDFNTILMEYSTGGWPRHWNLRNSNSCHDLCWSKPFVIFPW